MKIQYCSDLHLEFPENKKFLKNNPLLPRGDILLLAGDIVPFKVMDQHNDFFDYISSNFKTIYWVPGNHEYYYFDLAKKQGSFNEKIRDNIFLVNNFALQVQDIKFIFSTLWTHISAKNQWTVQKRLSDFYVIGFNNEKLIPIQYNKLHKDSLNFIKKELAVSKKEKKIVVTHHVPTFMHYPVKYKGDLLNEVFAVELYDLIEKSKIDYWIFGHHHENVAGFLIGKTKILTNQLGYVKYNEQKGFLPDILVMD
ncbi:MAG: metallophosphoesterase [Bacteroidia bacterium]|nr:metallophosphoesterase [Bacteroidia bacterium]